ncbi:MAG: hypothetical protein O3A46_14885, partial [Candidatus Poribacteria bacterium]|nr:hypothetical protein [Candidatus Poribacteria bacterium]
GEDEGWHESVATAIVTVDTFPAVNVVVGESSRWLSAGQFDATRRDPAWSPTGSEIAFASDERGSMDVWVASTDGRATQRLTDNATALDGSPSWSPNAQQIAFARREGETTDLYAVHRNTREVVPLMVSPDANADPAWSPDGNRLAFASDRDGNFEIYVIQNLAAVMNGEPPVINQITRSAVSNRDPAWSPDGQFLVFATERGGVGWRLNEARLSDGTVRTLLDTPHVNRFPRFSSDGKQLLFHRQIGSAVSQLRSFDLISGVEQPVTPERLIVGRADWSPRRDALVYERGNDLDLAELRFPEPTLEARIASPPNRAFLTRVTDVFGVARGSQMAHYRLEYAPAANTSAWVPITGNVTSPVLDDGFLGRWETTNLDGDFRLRLTAVGRNGASVEHVVTVVARKTFPELSLESPTDQLETTDDRVVARGIVSPGSTLTLNGERLMLDQIGRFSVTYPLEIGENTLTFVAANARGSETSITRRVARIATPFEVTVESPLPFQTFAAPYVEVTGTATDALRVWVDETEVTIDGDARFSRVLPINGEGVFDVMVRAIDRLGRETTVRRLALRATDNVIDQPDGIPPALVAPLPAFNATLTENRIEFTARIVDDRQFDASSLLLTFDEEVLDAEDWSYDATAGVLAFDPDGELDDGQHELIVEGADFAGNALIFNVWRVRIDTRPTALIVAAVPVSVRAVAGEVTARVALTSNRALTAVRNVQLLRQDQQIGAPLQLAPTETGDRFVYETEVTLAFGEAATLLASVRGRDGEETTARGEIAVGALSAQSGAAITLRDGAFVRFAQVDPTGGATQLIFRTADGLDTQRVEAQRRDMSNRGLSVEADGAAIYVIESVDAGVELPLLTLSAPQSGTSTRAWFRWNEDGQRWQPVAQQEVGDGVRTARNVEAGTYGLLEDVAPPFLIEADPPSGEPIPLERYFVEARFGDEGSGVAASGVRAFLDDAPVSVDGRVDGTTVLFRFAPTNLSAGLHTLRLIVSDRAGNSISETLRYVTVERFDFTAFKLVPNPAREEGSVLFRLTESADVELRIYTVNGELVHQASLQNVVGDAFTVPAGRQGFRWDLRNVGGRHVAP